MWDVCTQTYWFQPDGVIWNIGDVSMSITPFILLVAAIQAPVLIAQTKTTSNEPPSPYAVVALLAQQLPQKKLADCTDNKARSTSLAGQVTLESLDGNLTARGRDNHGQSWSASLPSGGFLKCEVWGASLQRGLPSDLIFLNVNQSGNFYGSELTILFFDKSGRPQPWQATGAFTSNRTGVSQIALDPATGNGQIVIPGRLGDADGGYAYTHNLYKITNSRIEKVVGSEKTENWPLISGNKNALVGTESAKTETSELDSATPAIERNTLFLNNVLSFQETEPLVYSNNTKSRYPKIVVLDGTDGSRQIFFDQYVTDAIAKIRKNTTPVYLKGQTCEEEECRPLILEARQ